MKAIIIGGGIGGLTAAIALHRKGIQSEVYERSPEVRETGATARFANGSEARGDLLIGADGLHSSVRKFLGHADPIRYSGYTAWRSVVPFDVSKYGVGESWGRGRRFGMVPMRGDRMYWFAT